MSYSRRLFFFDQSIVRDNSTGEPFRGIQDVRPTCTASGRGFLWLGDANGFIHRVDRTQQIVSFGAHSQYVSHAYQLKEHDLLVTVGTDENNEEKLKVWNTAKWTSKASPHCCRITNTVTAGQPAASVTCLWVDEQIQALLLGYSNGSVVFLKGDITRERQCKRQLVYNFTSAVTGLGLYLPSSQASIVSGRSALSASDQDQVAKQTQIDQSQLLNPIIFATSKQCIMSFVLGRREEVQYKTVLDRFGADFNCTTMVHCNSTAPQFAVACQDAVYFYNWDGRGPCLATDGNKVALGMFKQYLVILKGPPSSYLSMETSDLSDESLGSIVNSPTTVLIHEVHNKFIAGEFPVSGVRSMFIDGDGIYLLCLEDAGNMQYVVRCLSEKNTQSKLEMLFSKKNFQLAIDIANSQHFEPREMVLIFGRYADHLYRQKEYDAAVKEYTKTIGILEASFVIQRFLDGGHITQLAQYLEALNAANLASNDHLLLLLNCYCRLQDKERIERFVEDPINPNLNISTALHILRQAHFFPAALKLARAAGRAADCVGILLDDLSDNAGALAQIQEFSFDEALKAIGTYGHLLMDRMPLETVELLEKLCSHPNANVLNMHHFLKIFINNREGLMQFLERYIENSETSVKVAGVADTLLELLLYEISRSRASAANTSESESNANKESVVKQSDIEKLSALVLRLLQDEHLLYDAKKALLLCHKRQFYAGCLYLWEKEKMYEQLLGYYMETNAVKNVLQVCQRFGETRPNLWALALQYFACKPESSNELQQVIGEVDRHNLMPPLGVLQILSEADAEHSCSISSVRDYLLRHLETASTQTAALRKEVHQLREETMHNREVVRNLNSQVKIFQQQKCAICHQGLEPPSVHFLCDHSYHKLCFENYAYGDQKCPLCAPRNKKLLTEAADAPNAVSTTTQSAEQIISQLHQALRATRVPLGNAVAEEQETRSVGASSPRVNRVLANLLAQGSLAKGAAHSRSHSPLTYGSNAFQMTALSKDTLSVRSQDSNIQVTRPFSISAKESSVVPPPSTVSGTKSTSTGYFSAETHQSSRPDISATAASRPSATSTSTNPFGDSDSEEGSEKLGYKGTNYPSSGRDNGIGPSLSLSKPLPPTPFD
ncbi:unnamed protein product [Calicophoron daubneyi]|uniref:RING-type domain-containing protein n=1 Tax=Calicophoron daubneyi TaxID=300641 RepID=A0AAV2TYY9_CALDB